MPPLLAFKEPWALSSISFSIFLPTPMFPAQWEDLSLLWPSNALFLILWEPSPVTPPCWNSTMLQAQIQDFPDSQKWMNTPILLGFLSKLYLVCSIYHFLLHNIRAFQVVSGKESACQCRNHKTHRLDPWDRKIPCRRKWQPTPVLLLWESCGQRSLVGYSPQGHKESDMTEWLSTYSHLA